MPTYVPAKASTQFVTYVSLVSQTNTKLMQVNPTIAAGDFKVSIDGGALANLGTLPAVTPAGGSIVKLTLSIAEMAGAAATVVCSDAAGAEWCDLTVNIPTAARQIDDLAYPAVSGRSLAVDASGQVSVGALAANVITATAINADAITAAKIADGAIDRATLAVDTGLQSIRSGTAQAGSATTITLDAGASAVNGLYVDNWILLTGGTGAGQTRRIGAYVGATKVVTIEALAAALFFTVVPDATTTFAILPASWLPGVTYSETVNVVNGLNIAAIDNLAFAAGAIDAAALATDAVNEIVAAVFARAFPAGYDSLTFAQITEIMVAALAAKCSGMATTTATFRNLADSADVIVATVDASGNRSAVTRTP